MNRARTNVPLSVLLPMVASALSCGLAVFLHTWLESEPPETHSGGNSNGRKASTDGPPESDEPPPYIRDREYTVKEAAQLTGKAIVTIRKMIRDRRLTSKKDDSGRVSILGKDLFPLLSTQEDLDNGNSTEE